MSDRVAETCAEGPVLPCGHFVGRDACAYLRMTLGRSHRQRGVPCYWMTTHGFTRTAESLTRGGTLEEVPRG